MNALHLETAPDEFNEQDAIAFIEHVAVPETIIAQQGRRFIRHDDQQVSFGFPDQHCLTLTRQPDGCIQAKLLSRHRREQVSANHNPVIPLLKLNGGEFGIIRSAWHAAGTGLAAELRRRLNQYLGHNHYREHGTFDNRYVKPRPDQPLSLDEAFNNAVIRTRAAVTGLGYYPQLERLAFGLIYRLVGRDIIREATHILGPQATLEHANALIRHRDAIRTAYRRDPNLTTWWMLHHADAGPDHAPTLAAEDIAQQVRREFADAAGGCRQSPDSNLRYLTGISRRFFSHRRHPISIGKIDDLNYICAGQHPPYTIAKKALRNRDYYSSLREERPQDLDRFLQRAALPLRQRGVTLRRLAAAGVGTPA